MAASNTKECFREVVGKRVTGFLFDALPSSRSDLRDGTKTLVFDDGTGLTIAANGSFWRELSEDVSRAISIKRKELEATKRDIADVLAAAGERADT